jgi:hypothetical protein
MDVLPIIAVLIALVGATFAARNFYAGRSAPVRQRQEKLRGELKGRVRTQNRLAQAVTHLDRELPSSLVNADLEELRTYLKGTKHQFRAPSPAQLEAVIKSIDEALEALQVAQQARNDMAFNEDVQEIKRNVLRPVLDKALANINTLLNGLSVIEQKPTSVRKQIKQFKELA